MSTADQSGESAPVGPHNPEAIIAGFYDDYSSYLELRGLQLEDLDLRDDSTYLKDLTMSFLEDSMQTLNIRRSAAGLKPYPSLTARARMKAIELERQFDDKPDAARQEGIRRVFTSTRPILENDGPAYQDVQLLNILADALKKRGNDDAITVYYELYCAYGLTLAERRRLGGTSTAATIEPDGI